jgi:mRNA interferase HigB
MSAANPLLLPRWEDAISSRWWLGVLRHHVNLASVDLGGCGSAFGDLIANSGRDGGNGAVRVFNRNSLLRFGRRHADADRAVRELNKTLRSAAWSKMQDVIDAYPSATVLNAERVVFRVKGNDYRAIIALDFGRHAAFVKFVGTHAEYDRVDALGIDLYSMRDLS